ncbi:hypothetical protein SteCoe_34691 [Stentor coeruleus]|uniref:Uncharacterized protein n=1 Tax=Stentor coeruleus TaxID=5963 RepID=A0A1R2ATY8_9CILI|nr:hypothetical protein SteCoe_34691 [Stentor coeruleus]
MAEGLSVFKPETVVRPLRYSVNLNNRKLIFQQDLKANQQELQKRQDNGLDVESTQNVRTTVSRIPKKSAEYIKNAKRDSASSSVNKKKLTIKFIDKSEIEDAMTGNYENSRFIL